MTALISLSRSTLLRGRGRLSHDVTVSLKSLGLNLTVGSLLSPSLVTSLTGFLQHTLESNIFVQYIIRSISIL